LCAAALLVGARTARADETSGLQELLDEPIVETASKSSTKGATAPATSTILTSEDMRRYGIHSLDEAIDFLSLGVTTSNPLHAVDVGARGIMLPYDQGNHFLLLINGHAVNEPLHGTARFERGLGIPLEIIDHVEVILGPGAVLYGSNAMLGVINVITKRARDFRGLHLVGESEIGKSYRAAAGAGYELGETSELTLALDYYRQSGPALRFDAEDIGTDLGNLQPYRFSPNGPRDGIWGGRLATQAYGAEVPSAFMRLKMGDIEVNLHGKIYERAAPYDNRSFGAYTYFDDSNAYEVDRQAWIDVKHRATLSPMVQLTTRLYGDSFNYERYADTAQSTACNFLADDCRLHVVGASQWGGAEIQSSFDWLRDARLVTLLGIDGRLRHVSTKSDTSEFGTGKPILPSYGVVDKGDEILGAYIQQTWQPSAWLFLNAGARLDEDPRFRPVASPRVAASARTWTGGTLKAVYAEAFRTPSLGETSYSSQNQLLAKDLRPETVRSIEASLEQRFGTQRLLFGVFRSVWRDLIELHELSSDEIDAGLARGELGLGQSAAIAQLRNVSSVDNYGFNATVEGSGGSGAFRYGVNVTGTRSRWNDPTTFTHDLAVAPTFFGNGRVSYDLLGDWPTIGLAVHWKNRRPADRAFDGDFVPVPYAAPQFEARASLSGPVPVVRGLSYRMTANVALGDRGPYVVGPNQNAPSTLSPERSPFYLVPVDTFRATAGFQYDFAP
jgi:outer membrane cobalamin receptor